MGVNGASKASGGTSAKDRQGRRGCRDWIKKGECSRGGKCHHKYDTAKKGPCKGENTLDKHDKKEKKEKKKKKGKGSGTRGTDCI